MTGAPGPQRWGPGAPVVGLTGFEPAASSSRTRRATKLRHSPPPGPRFQSGQRGRAYRSGQGLWKSPRLTGTGSGSLGEGEVGDAAGRGHRLDVEGVLERLEAVPQPDTPPEDDRHHHEVQVVDESGGDEVAHHGRATAQAYVEVAGGGARDIERLGRGGVEEVEGRPARHLERRPGAVGEDVGRRVERRVLAPPATPVGVVLPPGRAELVGAHDLRTEAHLVAGGEGGVDAASAALGVPEGGGEHPRVQPLAGVAERRLEGLRLAGAEAVERDREVVDPDEGHVWLLQERGGWSSTVGT